MKQTHTQTTIRRIAIAQIIMIAGAFLICAILSLLVQGERIPEHLGGIAAVILTEVLVFAVCYLTVRPVPQKKLLLSVLTVAVFLLIRILFKAIAFPTSQWSMSWGITLTAGAAVLAGVVGSMKKERRR